MTSALSLTQRRFYGQEEYRKLVEKLTDAAFFVYEDKGIGRAAARALYGQKLQGSVTRLEQFAACAYAHFLKYGLELMERQEYQLEAVDMGNLFHQSLDQCFEVIHENGMDWSNITEEERKELVKKCVDQVTSQYGNTIMSSSARNTYLAKRVERITDRTIWALAEQVKKGDFVPSGFEVSFSAIDNLKAMKIRLSEDEELLLKLKQIAQTTAGFTGAELENLLNEAAIMAAKDRRRFVRQADIKSAFIKVGIGAEKRSKVISDKEKRITAYHETGHAILFHMLPDMEAVYTISIIPTGPGAAGYTMPQPENDDMFQTRGKMMQYITVCLGGRVAEELIFDDITTGASQDIKQATATARSMITKYGMSENLGLVAYDSDSDEVFIGRDWGHTKSYSENVAAAIDEEVRQMIEKCHDQAKQIILEHSYVLHECAKQLMEKEKLSRAEFEAIFEQEAQMTGIAPEVSGEI